MGDRVPYAVYPLLVGLVFLILVATHAGGMAYAIVAVARSIGYVLLGSQKRRAGLGRDRSGRVAPRARRRGRDGGLGL